ncbi:MAG: hypothetical protein ACK4RT_10380, partial [Erythrobacter sp.]
MAERAWKRIAVEYECNKSAQFYYSNAVPIMRDGQEPNMGSKTAAGAAQTALTKALRLHLEASL